MSPNDSSSSPNEQRGPLVSQRHGSIGDGNPFGDNNTVNVTNYNMASPAVLREVLDRGRALHQIAAPLHDFTGREAELRELHDEIIQGGVIISGMGGIGKTALARKLAAELEDSYPDAALYIDLKGVETTSVSVVEALQFFIRAFDPTSHLPNDVAYLQSLYLSLLHNKRALILLDNAKDVAQVKPLLPPTSCSVIVTSRQSLTIPGIKRKRLDTLPEDKACALLLEIAPRIGEHASEMAQVLGYLPLAIRVAASALAQRENITPQTHLKRLNAADKRLKLVEASLQLSYDMLDPDLQARWRALAVFPDSFDDAAVSAVCRLSEDDANDTLGELLSFSMVEWNSATSRYRLHDLARDFANSRLHDKERFVAQSFHSNHYLKVLGKAGKLYLSGNEELLNGLKLFDAERANIEVGQLWAKSNESHFSDAAHMCMYYPTVANSILSLRQTPHERIIWEEAALVVAQRLKKRKEEGVILGSIGSAYLDLGEPRRAIEYCERALKIAQDIGNINSECVNLTSLGMAYLDLGEPQRSIEYYEKRLNITKEARDLRSESAVLNHLGNAYTRLGELQRSLECHKQVLTIAREIGDKRREGDALGNIGTLYMASGDLQQALIYCNDSLKIAQQLYDRYGECDALGNLGNICMNLGDPQRAIEYYEQSLIIGRDIGNRLREGTSLLNMSMALRLLNEQEKSVTLAKNALTLFEKSESSYADVVRDLLAQWDSTT